MPLPSNDIFLEDRSNKKYSQVIKYIYICFKHLYKLLTVLNLDVKFSRFGNIYLWKNLFFNAHLQHYCASSMMEYLIIREHFVWLNTQRGTVFVLRLLLTTDTHQQIQQILIWGNELPKCICHRDICCLSVVWKPALTGVCAVPVLEAQKNSVRKGPGSCCCPHRGCWTLKQPVNCIWDIFKNFLFIGFPFQTRFIRRMESGLLLGRWLCISWLS